MDKPHFIMVIVLILIIFSSLYAQNTCYDTSRVEMILKYNEINKIINFTSYRELAPGDSGFILKRKPLWAFQKGERVYLDDIQFLDYVGMERESRLLRIEKENGISRKRVQLFLGIPLGIALGGTGIWWISKSKSQDKLNTIDYGIGSVAILGGIGTIYVVIKNMITASKTNYYEHRITYPQALNSVDRYNELLKLKCIKNK